MRPAVDHLTDDAVVDLALGLLEERERAAVLAHAAECAVCEERLRDAAVQTERARIRSLPVVRRTRLLFATAAAALILSGLAVTIVTLGHRAVPGARPGDAWVAIEEDSVALRDLRPAGDEARLSAALEAYRRRDAARVVDLLLGKPIPAAHEPLRLALAAALVEAGRPAEARVEIDRLDVDMLPQPARDRALWILQSALRREGNVAAADAVAARLAARPGEFMERARELVGAVRPGPASPSE